jgi:MFS family permease
VHHYKSSGYGILVSSGSGSGALHRVCDFSHPLPAILTTSVLAYFIALYSLASFATSALHLTQTQGAALQSILSAGQMVGRPIIGQALDIGGRLNITILAYFITGLSSLIIWLPAKSFGVLILFAIVQGLVGGTVWSAAAPISAKIVGVKDLGSALGMFWLMLVVPSLVGEPIAIALLDYSTGSLGRQGAEAYYISIGFCGGMGIVAGLLLYGAKRWLQGSWTVFRIT